MKAEDITVRMTLIDEVTPKLRAIRRYLWWMQYGDVLVGAVMVALPILTLVIGFVLGVALS